MTLHLDPLTEQRIQREIDLGHYSTPAELIAHAVTSLLSRADDWFPLDRERFETRLAESMAQAERGETIPGDRLLEVLADRRKQRIATQ